jgi:hypothetical protein
MRSTLGFLEATTIHAVSPPDSASLYDAVLPTTLWVTRHRSNFAQDQRTIDLDSIKLKDEDAPVKLMSCGVRFFVSLFLSFLSHSLLGLIWSVQLRFSCVSTLLHSRPLLPLPRLVTSIR